MTLQSQQNISLGGQYFDYQIIPSTIHVKIGDQKASFQILIRTNATSIQDAILFSPPKEEYSPPNIYAPIQPLPLTIGASTQSVTISSKSISVPIGFTSSVQNISLSAAPYDQLKVIITPNSALATIFPSQIFIFNSTFRADTFWVIVSNNATSTTNIIITFTLSGSASANYILTANQLMVNVGPKPTVVPNVAISLLIVNPSSLFIQVKTTADFNIFYQAVAFPATPITMQQIIGTMFNATSSQIVNFNTSTITGMIEYSYAASGKVSTLTISNIIPNIVYTMSVYATFKNLTQIKNYTINFKTPRKFILFFMFNFYV